MSETFAEEVEQCQAKFSCPKCRCILDAGHPGRCDQHCGQPNTITYGTSGGVEITDTLIEHLVMRAEQGYAEPSGDILDKKEIN